ncbi:unnamed protein product, partial [Discosporangium mesarthrocarpum]
QLGVSRRRKGRYGRPSALIDPRKVPTVHRMSYRKWAAKAGVPLSSLWRLWKPVGMRRDTMWAKPTLTDKQRLERVQFVLSHVSRKEGTGWVVANMYDWVHVDEKWLN